MSDPPAYRHPPYQGGQGGSNLKSIFNLIITRYLYLTSQIGSTLCYNQSWALKTIFSANYAYCSSWHSNFTERLI